VVGLVAACAARDPNTIDSALPVAGDLSRSELASPALDAEQSDGDLGPAPVPAVWQPKPETTWAWQLTGTLDKTVKVEMFDIDLFNETAQDMTELRSQGKVVICYFSAGSYEAWRPDAGDFPASIRGKAMAGWDELWIDIRDATVRAIMLKRLQLAKAKGCDGVEPDNVDGYVNETGFPLQADDQFDYLKYLSDEAHKLGLSIGLKNDLDQVNVLEPYFEWALNESCMARNECGVYSAFIDAGKAVFHTEYSGDPATICAEAKKLKFSTLIKDLDLGPSYIACWE
jgi:hypothetical protein